MRRGSAMTCFTPCTAHVRYLWQVLNAFSQLHLFFFVTREGTQACPVTLLRHRVCDEDVLLCGECVAAGAPLLGCGPTCEGLWLSSSFLKQTQTFFAKVACVQCERQKKLTEIQMERKVRFFPHTFSKSYSGPQRNTVSIYSFISVYTPHSTCLSNNCFDLLFHLMTKTMIIVDPSKTILTSLSPDNSVSLYLPYLVAYLNVGNLRRVMVSWVRR